MKITEVYKHKDMEDYILLINQTYYMVGYSSVMILNDVLHVPDYYKKLNDIDILLHQTQIDRCLNLINRDK